VSVVLSMLNLVPGGMGGSETYVRELLRELAERELDVSTVVAPVAAGFSGQVRETVAGNIALGPSTRERVRALTTALVRRHELSRLTAHARVVHFPFTVRLQPVVPGQRSVVTLLDVQHHDLPQLFTPLERAYRAVAYNRAARRADAVITISQFCKERIVHHLGVDPAHVHVAPLGVRGQEYQPGTAERDRFLLYPAKGWRHKNHDKLFEALKVLRRSDPQLRLILTGATPRELPAIPEGVEVRGLVSRAELASLYASAAATVFPSRYEGFGLPVVEAMSSGCPVAAARAGALPEVVGDAGVLFDPDDPADIARGVRDVVERSDELRALGLARARLFTWSACADVHVDVYGRLGA
jgi:glycosyltransferase involved in cell wall biosynthesis